MTSNLAKHKALKVLFQNKLYSSPGYNDLQLIAQSNQFMIIEYKKYTNSEYVSELIKKLRVENEIEQNDSFLYIKNNLRFLFINSDVSHEDKCSLLRHELGHIYDPDLKNSDVNYSKIKKEEFANEFAFYMKNPGTIFKLYVLIMKKWRLLLSIIILIACVSGFYFMNDTKNVHQEKSITTDTPIYENSDDTYYITSGGEKYHRKFCIIVRYRNNVSECTISDAISAGYEPCSICIAKE